MKNIIDFLSELRVNNNREWFEANKKRYKEALGEFNAFAEQLIDGIGEFDPSVRGLALKDCTYRIYRDVRFSKDKSPYKTHMGVYVCPKGKKSGRAGYYFHIEPKGDGSSAGGGLMSSGVYMPEPIVLRSVRDEILDNGGELLAAVAKAKEFRLDETNKLRRTPTGYPAGSEFDEYLKLKDFYVFREFDEKYLLAPDLVKRAVAAFKTTYPLSSILNRAVEFAYEEMM